MDPSLLIGMGLALVAVVASVILEGGHITDMFLLPPMILVFVGTFGVAMAGGIKRDVKALPSQLKRAATATAPDPSEAVETLVHLAGRARREGMLALEDEARSIEDDFLRRGLQMAIDGTDADDVAVILSAEVDTKRAADAAAAKLFNDMGGYAPTIGIIGTVLGLLHVLGQLASPDKLGTAIAGAFVATLWGVMSANVFWLPIGNRLKRLSQVECDHMEVVIEGILAIQAGASPRLVEQRLASLVPLAADGTKDAGGKTQDKAA
ncbi:MotA/TolQ/ExbB proton channel family protein [Rhodococcus sp. X156]|uniref:motility protein A n=1 Tax=Rhodococcus sp. X156 TaxID=2499145 RepID=UPI000FD91F29|nr:MotA/TolQ/ExbB proton channel family protein [Rhodococcus sp. X156]